MTTQPGISPTELLEGVRHASELLAHLVEQMEPSLERAAAVHAGQLQMMEHDAPELARDAVERAVAWARAILEPLENLLGLAATPPYLVGQDEIQKRIIRDLQDEVLRLRDEVRRLKAIALEGPTASAN